MFRNVSFLSQTDVFKKWEHNIEDKFGATEKAEYSKINSGVFKPMRDARNSKSRKVK